MSESIPLNVQNLKHSYGSTPTFSGLNLQIRSGELIALLGPSGCGKSSLLRSIAGFITPQGGSIHIGGKCVVEENKNYIAPEHRNVGMVFQDYALFPNMTVAQNIRFGIESNADANQRVQHLLQLFDLHTLEHRLPNELSGGQQQRVALARALAPKPQFLLLDEPFANLDAALRTKVGNEVRAALMQENTAALLVTHDREEALGLADQVAVLARADENSAPSIVQCGSPEEIYNHPKHAVVAQLTGPCALISATCQGENAETKLGHVTLSSNHTGSGTLVIRPEHLSLKSGPTNGKVSSVAYRGALTECYVETSLGQLQLFIDSKRAPKPQSDCHVAIVGPCCIIPH